MSNTTGTEHECRQQRRCKARARDDAGEWHGAGVERPSTLCRPCEENAFNAIRELGNDVTMLRHALLDGLSPGSGPKVAASNERSIPIPLAVDTLLSDIDGEATRWAVRVTKGDPIAHTQPLTAVCTNLGTLVDLPPQSVTVWRPHPDGGDDDDRALLDGVDAVLRLARLHQRTYDLLGLTEITTWLAECCHVCGMRSLTIDNTSAEQALVKCRNWSCRNVWSQDEFTRLSNPLAAA